MEICGSGSLRNRADLTIKCRCTCPASFIFEFGWFLGIKTANTWLFWMVYKNLMDIKILLLSFLKEKPHQFREIHRINLNSLAFFLQNGSRGWRLVQIFFYPFKFWLVWIYGTFEPLYNGNLLLVWLFLKTGINCTTFAG